MAGTCLNFIFDRMQSKIRIKVRQGPKNVHAEKHALISQAFKMFKYYETSIALNNVDRSVFVVARVVSNSTDLARTDAPPFC